MVVYGDDNACTADLPQSQQTGSSLPSMYSSSYSIPGAEPPAGGCLPQMQQQASASVTSVDYNACTLTPSLAKSPHPAAGIADTKTEAGAGLMVVLKGMSYTVVSAANRKEQLQLLHNVNGWFNPGQMSALMGPSGSGKTTALDIMSGRKTVGKMNGDLLIGGTKPSKAFWRRFTGYVEQQDTLIATLTVEQMIMYTAELKRPCGESNAAKKEIVDSVIKALHLESCRHRLIGNTLNKGISGGQAKRVNIAIALVTQPRVLFLDEPTSGLDSWTANEVMTYVKALTASGITIVTTIHSPTAYTFNLFDKLMLLLRGHVAYFGPGSSVVSFFQQCFPDLKGVPEGENPAEWVVDLTTKVEIACGGGLVLSAGYSWWKADHDDRAEEFADMYAKSQLAQHNLMQVDLTKAQNTVLGAESKKALHVTQATVTPSWWAFWVLFKYRMLRDWSTAEYILPRIGDKILFCFVIFTLFWKLGNGNTTGDWNSMSAVLFMWAVLPGFGAVAYMPALVLERPLYLRERDDGLYLPITYLSSKIVGEGVLACLISLITAVSIWFALQLRGLWVVFWVTYLNTLCFGIVLAYLVAALSPDVTAANAVLPAFVTVWILSLMVKGLSAKSVLFFVGLFVPTNDMPVYWRWFSYINPLRYAWGTLMKNQFSGCCDAPFLNGVSILKYYDLDGINPWVWQTIQFGFSVFCFIGALLALTFIQHRRR